MQDFSPLPCVSELPSPTLVIIRDILVRLERGQRVIRISAVSEPLLSRGSIVPYNPIKAQPSSSAKVGNTVTTFNLHIYIEDPQKASYTLEVEHFLPMLGKGNETTTYDQFKALLRVIHSDMHSLVDIIHISCERIREGTAIEELMQKRVKLWRNLTLQLNFTLMDVEQQLHTFVSFTYDSNNDLLATDERNERPSGKLAMDTRQILRNCSDLGL
ncbi:hypothetical protein ACN47E_008236 [Coniothyrium glycines]